MNRKVALGIYRLADPKISITSVASMTIGASVAATEAPLDWVWLLMLGIAMFCMEVAKNAWGDVYDYDSGTDLAVAPEDKTDFSGGKRVMVDQLLSRQQTWLIAFLFGAAGLMIGALIVFMREPQVFWIGMAGLILGWSYHGPPLQLVYRGLGEIAVLLIYGPVIALSTYLIQRHHWNTEVLWLSLPLGIFITAFLWVNEFPDHDADQSANKRNMVVLLGKHRASRTLPVIYLAGFALMLLLPVITTLPLAVFWGAIAVPTAMLASLWCWQNPLSFYRDKPVQPMALLTFVLYPLGVLSGLYFDGHML
ncbi:MAG: prenyltransferase [Pseudomonadales bacterium]|nr:prenyltransferase [Pseudomonadales bacterium]